MLPSPPVLSGGVDRLSPAIYPIGTTRVDLRPAPKTLPAQFYRASTTSPAVSCNVVDPLDLRRSPAPLYIAGWIQMH